jgi:uncharacterized protein (DUF362 family)
LAKSTEVAVVRHKDNVPEEVSLGVKLLGGLNIKSDTVIIKPNLCILDTPESGCTSDSRIVETLLNMLQDSSKKVKIIESGNYAADLNELYKHLGYERLAQRYGCELVNLNKTPIVRINIGNLKFRFPKLLLDKDKFYISVGKIKTHLFEKMTCIWKNQWGCIAQKEKRPYHPFMSEILHYMNTTTGIDLAIADGIVGMGGVGPTDGHPIKTGLLLLGKDALAVDSVACRVMGINPFSVPTLKFAYERGAGELDPQRIKVLGNVSNNIIRSYDVIPGRAYTVMRMGLRIGRIRRLVNVGMMMFNVGNFMCPRDIHAHGTPSLMGVLKRSMTSDRWKL